VNELYIAPSMLMDVPPLAFLEAARDAGYHGVGLRLQKSPQASSISIAPRVWM